MEPNVPTPALPPPAATHPPSARWRRVFWDGVLPEAAGLGFVLVILGGLCGAFWIADYSWQERIRAAQQEETDHLALVVAALLGNQADQGELPSEKTFEELAASTGLRALRWSAPDGACRLAWPILVAPTAARPETGSKPPPFADARTLSASAAVQTRFGAPGGQLQIERGVVADVAYRTSLLWKGGLAVAATLLVFIFCYDRLRRHLRPVAAIERNLSTYAAGLEKELLTLTLSDSLGSVAQSWNRLVAQLAEAQGCLPAGARGASAPADVLARFENAVFRAMVDRLPFGVLRVGMDESINYANASASALLGRAPDTLLGVAVNDAVVNPSVAQAVRGVQSRARAGLAVDHTHKDRETESTLRFRILPLSDRSAGGEVLITIEDISQLREGQRARDNFLYHVTHELRTPLTNIHAYAETLTKPDFDDEQTRKECYNVLISETERLSRLVEDILSISQLEVGTARLDMGDVDLMRLMRQMVQDNLGAADEHRIELTLSLPPKVPKLRGDKQRLSVLLNNLIGNALKYTREGGKVHVQVEVAELCVRIAVSDTGIGIAAEDQSHVFEKFYRAANAEVQAISGTGLGLALAREVARLHGGDILLESELGQGSTFTIELPLTGTTKTEVATR